MAVVSLVVYVKIPMLPLTAALLSATFMVVVMVVMIMRLKQPLTLPVMIMLTLPLHLCSGPVWLVVTPMSTSRAVRLRGTSTAVARWHRLVSWIIPSPLNMVEKTILRMKENLQKRFMDLVLAGLTSLSTEHIML